MKRMEKLQDKSKRMCENLAQAHVQMLDFVTKRPASSALVLEKCAYQDRIRKIAQEILDTDDLNPERYEELTSEQDEMQFGIGTINNLFRNYSPEQLEKVLTINFDI